MPARPEPETSEAARALVALRRLVRALRTASRDTERAHAVTAAQLFVLREIAAHPDGSVGQLARRTHTTQSTASEVVARLVDAGLVERRAARDDARRQHLSLSARGRAVVTDAPPSMPERLLAAFESLPAARRHALADGLAAWTAAAGLDDAPAPMFFERPARPVTKRSARRAD